MEVVSKEEFNQLVAELRVCQQEVTFLRGLLSSQRWLSRERTQQALDVSKTTLWKLTKSGQLAYRKEGRRILYDVYAMRTYLTAQKIEPWHAEQRILKAAYSDV